MTTLTTSADDLDARLKALIESDPALVTDPYPVYRDLLAEGPVRQWGPTVVVSGFSAVKSVGDDAVTYSNRWSDQGSRAEAIRAALTPEQQAAFDEVGAFERLYMSRTDGEQHERLRGIAARFFRPRKLASLADTVQQYIDELIDRMRESGEDDIVAGFTSQLPTVMICSLLDIPVEDVPKIKGWAARIGKNRGGAVAEDLMSAHAAITEFRAYVKDIIDTHYSAEEVTSDLVGALQDAQREARIEEEELLATIVVLLFGGSDTTTALLGNGLHALLSHRDQWDLLVSDPDKYTFGAVEELIRYLAPVQTTWRVTTGPTSLEGVEIPAGTTVLLVLGAANRDPAKFHDPDRLDIERGSVDHLAFLSGAHFCIGAALARLEANAALKTLATRFPGMRMTSSEPVAFVGNVQFRSVGQLRVDWGS